MSVCTEFPRLQFPLLDVKNATFLPIQGSHLLCGSLISSSRKKSGGLSTLLALRFCSVPIAQNNPYAQVAYLEVVYSIPFQKKEHKQILHICLMAYSFPIYILNIHQYTFLNIHFCICPSQVFHNVDLEDVSISILHLRKVRPAQVRKWS